jgi:cysteinyl-tRNA synthetase
MTTPEMSDRRSGEDRVRGGRPTFSVIMPAYNSAGFNDRSLETVFHQSFQDYEVIVADDASRDATPEKLRSYGDRIQPVFLKENRGAGAARNAAIAEAEERWERLARAYEAAVDAVDSTDARTKIEDDTLRGAVTETREEFRRAMNDDFNVREASTALLELASAVNLHVDAREEYDYRGLREAVETFEALGGDVFGLQFGVETEGDVRLAEELIELVLDVREQEREAGNYERADDLRDALAEVGVKVQDSDDGPSYRFE